MSQKDVGSIPTGVANHASLMGKVTRDPYKFSMLVRVQHDVPQFVNRSMNFKEFLMLSEASYAGNIGMMEMFKFYQIATPEQKAKMKELLVAKKQDEAWQFLQSVTKTELKPT